MDNEQSSQVVREENAVAPQELVQNPILLYDSFKKIVGRYLNTGIVDVDADALLRWEAIADKALQALSLEQLRDVSGFYENALSLRRIPREEWDIAAVICNEINSISMSDERLKPHLRIGAGLEETVVLDQRIDHLVKLCHRYPCNLDEAFAAAIAEQPVEPTTDLHANVQPINKTANLD